MEIDDVEKDYVNNLSTKNKIYRLVWQIGCFFFFRPFVLKVFNPWRIFFLRMFGAKLHPKAIVYSNVKIWFPKNLEMDAYACLGPNVNCYNVNKIIIGKHSVMSQDVFLCTASHNIYSSKHELITAPIIVKDKVWIAVDAFVAMGVTIGEGAVVGARSSVFSDVEDWSIVGGNPAKFIKKKKT